MDHLVTIELFGHPFTFKADSDAAKAREVADYLVDEVGKVESQVSNKSTSINKNAILILAALNIANEYFKLRDTHRETIETLSLKTVALLSRLNDSIPESGRPPSRSDSRSRTDDSTRH